MPIFKTNKDIFYTPWEEEINNVELALHPVLYLPPTKTWTYERELKIEDVDVWEVLWEGGGAWGLYAAWEPYAEFYILRVGWQLEKKGWGVETYYGAGCQKKLITRLKELNIPYALHTVWCEPEDMWLYQ